MSSRPWRREYLSFYSFNPNSITPSFNTTLYGRFFLVVPVSGQTYPDRNGEWSAWSEWGGCSVSCGSGQRTQIRRCDNPPTDGAGKPCPGDRANVEACNTQQCPRMSTWIAYIRVYVNWKYWSLPKCV